jgi:hypothetical protein
MEEDLKALSGIAELESEEGDEVDLIRRASNKYDFIQLVNSIGTLDFKSIYENIMNNEYSIEERYNLAVEILDKIQDVYGIELTLSNTPSLHEIVSVFKFIKFLEYDYISFIADIWKFTNADQIMKVVDEQIETHFLSEIISNFLRTYNKEDMIRLFIELTEKSKMRVVLKIEEEEI